MFNRILHQGLQNQKGHETLPGGKLNLEPDLQPFLKARLHDADSVAGSAAAEK
jgi:hypothetical protein